MSFFETLDTCNLNWQKRRTDLITSVLLLSMLSFIFTTGSLIYVAVRQHSHTTCAWCMCIFCPKEREKSQTETALYDVPSLPCDKIDIKENKAYQPTDIITIPKGIELQQNISYVSIR